MFFKNYKVWETELAGRKLTLETGKMCGLAGASIMARYGDTNVLCNVTMSAKPREGVDFFPLSVDYEEKMYSVGRIPGSFQRREARPSEKAILTSRCIDRPIRPLFPKDMRNDVSVVATVMSVDPDCSPEITAMIGVSAAIAISDIPWDGPISGVNVGLVDGQIVINPTLAVTRSTTTPCSTPLWPVMRRIRRSLPSSTALLRKWASPRRASSPPTRIRRSCKRSRTSALKM